MMLILKIKIIILYVIIYGLMDYKYQKIGKTNNIKIHQNMIILNIKIRKVIGINIVMLQML